MPRREVKQTESGEKEPIIVLSSSESGGESEEEEESSRTYLDIPPRDELLNSLPKIPDVTYPDIAPPREYSSATVQSEKTSQLGGPNN